MKINGYEVFLPQEESGLAYEQINEKNKREINKKIFEEDVKGLRSCDILLFVLDGRVPDEGACVELGMAYAYGIPSLGFKTDTRALDYTGDDNLMIEACMDFRIVRNLNDLEEMLKNISKG